MPPAKKAYRKKRAAPKRRKAPRRKRSSNVSEYASLSETRSLAAPGGGGFTYNTMYNAMNIGLADYVRAPLVAQAYQHYRIKHVKLTLKPSFDTFSSESTTGYGKPFLYHMIDKAGAIPTAITLEGLKGMGARPRALDEKPLTISWAPSVLNEVLTTGGGVPTAQGSAYKISPWLNTNSGSVVSVWNPSSVDHLGCFWTVAAPNYSSTNNTYSMEIEVQFEFKKPLLARAVGAVDATPARLAVIDASPDGIEGGNDGITIPLHA